VRYLGILLAATLSILGCALNLTAGTAAARQTVITRAAKHAAGVHASSACMHGARRVCQASATSPRHSGRSQHRVPAPSGGLKPTKVRTSVAPSSAAAAKARAAVITAILATPCGNTDLMPEAGNLGLAREAVLCLINRERAQNSESPLRPSGELEQAAEGHSHELVTANYFAHVSPGGETPVDRVRETGYIPGPSVGYVIGENLAWGTYGLATPAEIVAAWMASPGHRANILEGQYSETGIGITPQVPGSLGNGAPGATYAQEFGVILH
jgi:uncharacterized protein YkwD